MATGQILTIPLQMVSDSEKKKESWQHQNIDAFESLILFENRQVKSSWLNKQTNYNLKRGILNRKDIEKTCNPLGLKVNVFPDNIEHKGIGNAKVELLIGEHRKRKFDWRVVRSASDQLGIKEVEEKKTQEIYQFFVESIQNKYPEEIIAQKIQKLQEFMNTPAYDIAEAGCNKILKYDYKYLNLKDKFDDAFEDALIAAEQYMFVEDLNGELVVRRGDPTKIFTFMDAYATTEEGLEAYVEIGYHTPSSLVDMFHSKLSKEDTKKLLTYNSAGGNFYPTYSKYGNIGELLIPSDSLTAQVQDILPVSDIESAMFSTAFDSKGNVRLLRVGWKSKRKIKIIKVTDENGVSSEKPVHEKYKVDTSLGEELVREEWISEWWRGYKIGTDIYVGIEPVPYLSTSMDNISKQQPPLIMQVYNTNSSKAQSLMDILKPYDYLYDIFDYRRQHLINLIQPDTIQFPVTMIPDNMKIEEFMNFIMSTGWMPLDPSADAITPKGHIAAGQMNTVVAQRLQATQQSAIITLTEVLRDIQNTMSIVSGVTDQRQGAIDTRELVGNVERSVTQSSHTTERWFSKNDFFKRRVLDKILNTHLNIFRKNPKKLAYITDDFTAQILTDNEMNAILTGEYNVMISNSSEDALLLSKIEQLFQLAIQSGTVQITDLVDLYKTESIAEMSRVLKAREEKKYKDQQVLQEQQMQIAQQQNQINAEDKERNYQLELEKLALEREKMMSTERIKIAEIDARIQTETIKTYIGNAEADVDNDGTPDQVEIMKAALKEKEINMKIKLERDKLAAQKEMHNSKIQADKELEKIKAKNKPKPANKK